MSATAEAGSYIALFLIATDGKYHVEAGHWDEIDAAYNHWIERRIDKVLSLTCNDGGPLLIAASMIGGLALSTPATRQRSRELDEAIKAESGFTE